MKQRESNSGPTTEKKFQGCFFVKTTGATTVAVMHSFRHLPAELFLLCGKQSFCFFYASWRHVETRGVIAALAEGDRIVPTAAARHQRSPLGEYT